MSRVIHFEIQAENPEHAMTFYETLFGWKFTQWGDVKYWVVATPQPERKAQANRQ